MVFSLFTKEKQNFIRFVKARDDVMTFPLRDILDWQINPKDLHRKIQSCSSLINGNKKLDSNQLRICYPSKTTLTDYNDFDVTLLYKLIRNLCPGLKPTQGWGNKPNVSDSTIGDDIERIRIVRNEIVHSKSPRISDGEFQSHWSELKLVIGRFQKILSKYGYKTNYEENLQTIEELALGRKPREEYKTFLVLEYAYSCLQLSDRRGKLYLQEHRDYLLLKSHDIHLHINCICLNDKKMSYTFFWFQRNQKFQ